MRFWDSSAIVPLVIEQASSAEASEWVGEDGDLVIWTLTPIEIVSALQRVVHVGALKERTALAAEDLVVELLEGAHEITAVDQVKVTARRILRTHPLRAADALQLAAALIWAEHDARGEVFHTLDQRLAFAAMREGFRVVPQPNQESRVFRRQLLIITWS